jgi:ATP-dependent exoDNAse (exonuclease V) alpha subunit
LHLSGKSLPSEKAIAERLLALSRAKLPWNAIDADKALPWVEQRISLELAPSQKAAVHLALACKVLVITGGPGVGKTTIVNAILRILAAKTVKLLLCAPTGRAAKEVFRLAACALAPDGPLVLEIAAGLVIPDSHRQRTKTDVTGR